MTDRGEATVIVADDHEIVRRGTCQILDDIPDVRVVAEVADGLSAIAAVKLHQPRLLLLDAAMPHARGIEVLADARRWSPSTAVILLTGFTAGTVLAQWLDADVEGILLKTSTPEDIRAGIETVLAGGRYISPKAQAALEVATARPALTDREREVLSSIAMGRQSREIADRLSISARTVEKHRASLMAKVGVKSVAQLIGYALREGLLDDQSQL